MSEPIRLDIRCGYCNKKLSEVTPPVTLMIQRIKCPRCGEIVETYVIKPSVEQHKPQETSKYKPEEIKAVIPEFADYKKVTETVIAGETKIYG